MQNAVGASMGNQILHHIYCTGTVKSLLLMLHCKIKCGCQGAEPEDRGARMLHMRISAQNIFAGKAEYMRISAQNIFAGKAEWRVRMASFKTPFVASPIDARKSISESLLPPTKKGYFSCTLILV